MSEPNIYENVEKYKGKVKYRNLDPELQKLIGSGGGSDGSYDDTEIREQIESIKQDLKEYTNNYADLSTTVNNSATLTDLENYRKKSVDITYYDLDADLKNRIDNPDIAPGIDQDKVVQISNDINDIKSQVNVYENNIQNNTNNITSLTQEFNDFKQSIETDEVQHEQTIASNTNRIEQLEDAIANGIDIDISQLPPEISNQLEIVNEVKTDLTALQQQVSTNTSNISTNKNNISTNKANISSIQSSLDNFKSTTNNTIATINSTLTSHQSNINNLQNDLDNLSIDSIIAQNASATNPDTGKIKEANLNSSIIEKLNKASDTTNQYDIINNQFQSLGSFVDGDTGNFVYKSGSRLGTKNILNFFYVANTTAEVTQLKSFGNCYIYDKTENILYEASVDDTIQPNTDGKYDINEVNLSEIENGLQDERFNYILLLDGNSNILYLNNDGTLMQVIDFTKFSLGKYWSFYVDDSNNTLQIKYNDDCIQLWSPSDDISTLSIDDNASLNENEESSISIERTLTLQPNTIEEVYLDNISNLKVLILDEDNNSLTKGLYIDHLDNCVVAYTDTGIKLVNKDNKPIKVKILN